MRKYSNAWKSLVVVSTFILACYFWATSIQAQTGNTEAEAKSCDRCPIANCPGANCASSNGSICQTQSGQCDSKQCTIGQCASKQCAGGQCAACETQVSQEEKSPCQGCQSGQCQNSSAQKTNEQGNLKNRETEWQVNSEPELSEYTARLPLLNTLPVQGQSFRFYQDPTSSTKRMTTNSSQSTSSCQQSSCCPSGMCDHGCPNSQETSKDTPGVFRYGNMTVLYSASSPHANVENQAQNQPTDFDYYPMAKEMAAKLADADQEEAARMLQSMLEQVSSTARMSTELKMAEMRTRFAKELAQARTQVKHGASSPDVAHLQQKLNEHETKTRQQMMQMESRLFELQRSIHQMQRRAENANPFKLASRPAQESQISDQFGSCPRCRQQIQLRGIPSGNEGDDRVFKQVMTCGCPETSHKPLAPSASAKYQVRDLTYQPSDSQLRSRIGELERQLQENRSSYNRQASYQSNSAFSERPVSNRPVSNRTVADGSAPDGPVTPLLPASANRQLSPMPYSSSQGYHQPTQNRYQEQRTNAPLATNNAPLATNYVPRNDTAGGAWISRSYYIGDLLRATDRDAANEMIEKIKEQIEPSSWVNNSFAKIRFQPNTLSIYVMQSYSNHAAIQFMLDSIRTKARR